MPHYFDSDEEDQIPTTRYPARNRERDSDPTHASSSRTPGPLTSSPTRTERSNAARGMRSSSTAFALVDDNAVPLGSRRYDLGEIDEEFGGMDDPMNMDEAGLGLGAGLEDFEGYTFQDDNDVKKLIRVWMRERGTRDIMLFEEELLDNVVDKVEQQAKMLALLRSDPSTSDEEHFKLQLVSTEVERLKYLIRSYLRCRLDKVEKYSHYITITPTVQTRLSDLELTHARQYTTLLHQHFSSSVLNSLPEWLRKMDDVGNDGLSMVRQPNKDVPVLIHVLRDCGEVVLSDGERASLEPESMHLIKYELVERFVRVGWVEVL